ncbi:Zinc finger and BTB domain-containing protein 17 [Fusarium oxysporum f. sp. cubense]|uniref:Zinc finger and BTB domain-containing protein 17 n=1 Tax=Fusarium oxysporum f. sp. cubense TaxID=61366 RepID=A0A559LAT3_FUSOC|nr:Zinc finger and BTB domain-containing protein 17 [Fusarium oxysporum f. sp. cubense]
MERACKRIKLEEGEPFSADQCIVVDTHTKEEQISEEEESGSEESGSEDSEEYQSCESGGEEESNSEPQVAQGSSHDLSTSEAKAASNPHCSECRRSFQSSADIERHTSKWHYNFICYACDEGFSSESQLHRKKYKRMGPLIKHFESRACALRDWIEETGLKDLLIALKEPIEKRKASTFRCNVCHRNFGKAAALIQHQRDKHERTYCCACKTNFGSPAKKQQHVMSGISLKPGMYICDHCDPKVPFGTEKEFCDHLWLEHVACGPCGRTFKSVELRKQHDAELHHRCGVCYRFFISSGELTEHRETHVVKPPVVEQPVHVPAPVKREPTPPPTIPAPIQVKIEIRREVPISRVAPVVAERVPVKTEVIPVTRVTPTTRPVIFAPYPPRPTPAQVPENKKTQSLIAGFLIRKS